ncbi:condensation domain-containing protein, partial [Streptomyces sp. NPDC059761]|uniref:condensation domain-containing protein n=1 Tax=Streptomyces sp. NPDC059761 TaxID=3346937 RepID=UPI00365DF9F5
YGLLRHLNPTTGPELASLTPPQIAFNYLGRMGAGSRRDWDVLPETGVMGGGADPAMPMKHAVEVNAVTHDLADGPVLEATWSWAGDVLAERDVRELAELWQEALHGLAAHVERGGAGGYTPSDLALVDLTQDQIEVYEATAPGSVEDVLPLSPLQEGFLYHALLDEEGTDVYTAQVRFDFEGALDAAALRTAGERLLARHANLRVAFRHDGLNRPVQVVLREVPLPWTETDLTGLDEADREAEAGRLADEARTVKFDLGSPPLLRLTLLRLAEDRHRLLLTNHHILWDGWSMPVLIDELFTLYAQGGGGTLPKVTPYRDYLAWLAAQDRDTARAAWAKALAGLEGPTLVAPHIADHAPDLPGLVSVELSEELTARLTEFGRGHGVTMNTLVQAAWGMLLARTTGRDDVVFGMTVSGRPPELSGVERMVGLFINTLPVRVRFRDEQNVSDVLRQLHINQVELMEHHHLGLAEVQQKAGGRTLFDTTMVFESYPLDASEWGSPAEGLRLTGIAGVDATHYSLALSVLPGARLTFRLGYRSDAFAPADAELHLTRLGRLLEAMADDPDRPAKLLDFLTPQERYRLLAEFGGYGPVPV